MPIIRDVKEVPFPNDRNAGFFEARVFRHEQVWQLVAGGSDVFLHVGRIELIEECEIQAETGDAARG